MLARAGIKFLERRREVLLRFTNSHLEGRHSSENSIRGRQAQDQTQPKRLRNNTEALAAR